MGDRNIAIWHEDGSLTPLLITKKDFRAYRLYRHEDGQNLQAQELLPPDSTYHKLEGNQHD